MVLRKSTENLNEYNKNKNEPASSSGSINFGH